MEPASTQGSAERVPTAASRVRLMDFGLVRRSAATDEAEAEAGE